MRKIWPDGRNNCRINGSPVSVTQLKELGSLLLDIHGQNDGRKLLNEECHRAYLDSFGNLEPDLAEYRKAYDSFRKTAKEIEALTLDEGEKERRVDSLKFQIAELERADLRPGEYSEKSSRRELLKNAVKLTESVTKGFEALYGRDELTVPSPSLGKRNPT
jgi:DNA repair protein RecN (Recombination protein N)